MTGRILLLAFVLAACSAQKTTEQRPGVRGDSDVAGASSQDSADDDPSRDRDASLVLDVPEAGATAFIDGDDAGAEECGRQRFDVRRRPADVLLVLDRSASMKKQPSGSEDDAPSKWELVVPALEQAISATDNALAWGLKFFPEGDDAGECSDESYPGSIAVPIAPMNARDVNQAIEGTRPTGDGTPTGDAVDEAVKYLGQLDDGNDKYILLATDGEPSCSGDKKGGDAARAAAYGAVEAAAMSGIDTFVVGIATSKKSASETLTELAKAGHRAPSSGYYLANTQDELVAALRAITSAVTSCRFPLSSRPPNPDHVGVLIGMTRVPKDPAQHDGWNYVDADFSAVELFGPACETVKASGADTVNVVFGCKADELF